MSSIKLSVVIPTVRENDDSYLLKIAATYPSHEKIEYIVVDQDTPKKILEHIKRSDFNILYSEDTTRAQKLNVGLQKAKGDIVIFHHPRSLIEEQGLLYLMKNESSIGWGGFTHRFDQSSLGLRFTSWYSNQIRPRTSGIVYLDHCIFFRKSYLTQPIPDIPIFEDTELSHILKRQGPPKILPFISETSAIRFKSNGFLKQAWINQKLKIQYHLGRSKQKMNQTYEKNLNLNG